MLKTATQNTNSKLKKRECNVRCWRIWRALEVQEGSGLHLGVAGAVPVPEKALNLR